MILANEAERRRSSLALRVQEGSGSSVLRKLSSLSTRELKIKHLLSPSFSNSIPGCYTWNFGSHLITKRTVRLVGENVGKSQDP